MILSDVTQVHSYLVKVFFQQALNPGFGNENWSAFVGDIASFD